MLVVLIGLGAGLGGAALMELLKGVQHLAWSYHLGSFLEGVQGASATRRVVVLTIGGVVAVAAGRSPRRSGCATRVCRCSEAWRGRCTRS
jgi:chloride channel protein, CIC family